MDFGGMEAIELEGLPSGGPGAWAPISALLASASPTLVRRVASLLPCWRGSVHSLVLVLSGVVAAFRCCGGRGGSIRCTSGYEVRLHASVWLALRVMGPVCGYTAPYLCAPTCQGTLRALLDHTRTCRRHALSLPPGKLCSATSKTSGLNNQRAKLSLEDYRRRRR